MAEQWLTEGCTTESEGTGSTTCSFKHLTNFAVLMQIDPESNVGTQSPVHLDYKGKKNILVTRSYVLSDD